jgi:hypothetical protein
MMARHKRGLKCSFCGKSEKQVKKMVGGANACICDACVSVCNTILGAMPAEFEGWEKMSDQTLLDGLKTAEASVDGARAVLQAMVESLRQRGTSWESIGGALGVSRQAAWERFS